MSTDNHRDFKIPRLFSTISLLSILIAVIILFFISRYAVINLITEYGEQINTTITDTPLALNHDELAGYIEKQNRFINKNDALPLTPQLTVLVNELMNYPFVTQVRIFNRHHVTLYSTDSQHLGEIIRNKSQTIATHGETISSYLSYRDALSFFSLPSDPENRIHTFIPVADTETHLTIGVFEIVSDVRSIVDSFEIKLRYLWIFILLLSFILFTVLHLLIRYANGVIRKQENTILERNTTLEEISNKLLEIEEVKRKEISEKLHEDIAQTLSALKLNLEHNVASSGELNEALTQQLSKRLIPAIHQAINDVRNLAMEIRPSSIDDVGLIATLNWIVRDYKNKSPRTHTETSYELTEEQIPDLLKPVIFRVVNLIVTDIILSSESLEFRLTLGREANYITLQIENTVNPVFTENSPEATISDTNLQASSVRERIYLSGGDFRVMHVSENNTVYKISWNC